MQTWKRCIGVSFSDWWKEQSEHKIFLNLNNFSFLTHYLKLFNIKHILFKNFYTLWPLFYGWGSTASRLVPLRGGSLLFTTKFPEIPGTHFINLGRKKGWVNLGATPWFRKQSPRLESSTLSTRPSHYLI